MKNVLLQHQEYPLIASPQLAKELGTAAATFLQKLHFLISETRKYKQKRNLTQTGLVHKADEKNVKTLLGLR